MGQVVSHNQNGDKTFHLILHKKMSSFMQNVVFLLKLQTSFRYKSNVQEVESHAKHQQGVLELFKYNFVIEHNRMKQWRYQQCSETK